MNSSITAHEIDGSAENGSGQIQQFHYLQVEARGAHAGTTDRYQVSDIFRIISFYTFP